jgi:Rhodopirellula transposase DDE domain
MADMPVRAGEDGLVGSSGGPRGRPLKTPPDHRRPHQRDRHDHRADRALRPRHADYPTGVKYTKKDIDALPIIRHAFHGEWNYTVRPPTRRETPKLFCRRP